MKVALFIQSSSFKNLIVFFFLAPWFYLHKPSPFHFYCYHLNLASLIFSISPYNYCSSVQLLTCVRLFATTWTATGLAFLSITNSRSWLKLMSIELVMPSNHLILCCPRLLPPSIFPSIRVFSDESVIRIGWPKYWSFSFSISPSSEYSGLITFRMDWLDLFTVQGTLKSLFQHHGFKSINSLVLSFLYGPTLTSIHDYWKNHSFD